MNETTTTSILVSLIGREATEKITATFGGEAIYIPRKIKDGRDDLIRHDVHALMSAGATCMSSYRQVAKKYDLSERRVRAIATR